MIFSNLIAYCKGMYEQSGDYTSFWKDMGKCIICDGYLCFSKKDVVQFCINQFYKFAKDYPNEAYKVSFQSIYYKMTDIQNIWNLNHNTPLSNDDAILAAFIDVMRYGTDIDTFNDGYLPSNDVLPVVDYISVNMMNTLKSKFKEQHIDEFTKKRYRSMKNWHVNKIKNKLYISWYNIKNEPIDEYPQKYNKIYQENPKEYFKKIFKIYICDYGIEFTHMWSGSHIVFETPSHLYWLKFRTSENYAEKGHFKLSFSRTLNTGDCCG